MGSFNAAVIYVYIRVSRAKEQAGAALVAQQNECGWRVWDRQACRERSHSWGAGSSREQGAGLRPPPLHAMTLSKLKLPVSVPHWLYELQSLSWRC